jgi:chloramphenicol O-acetyltransferase
MTPFISVFSRMIVDLNEDYKKFKQDYKKNYKKIINNQIILKKNNLLLIQNVLLNYNLELQIYKENLNDILHSIKTL